MRIAGTIQVVRWTAPTIIIASRATGNISMPDISADLDNQFLEPF